MRAVSNSGPLIWLGKYGLLHLLRRYFSTIEIPRTVYVEVVEEGLKRGYPDAQIVKNGVDEGWVQIEEVDEEDVRSVGKAEAKLGVELGRGEGEAVALAQAHAVKFLLTNDEGASIVSRALGLKARGVLYILLRAVKEKALERREAVETLDKMINDCFWVSPAVVHDFHKALEKVRRKI